MPKVIVNSIEGAHSNLVDFIRTMAKQEDGWVITDPGNGRYHRTRAKALHEAADQLAAIKIVKV